MLNTKKYLSENGLDKLVQEFGINVKINNENTMVILNYDQIESSHKKFHPIVRECRALVLENNTWNLIARSFFRFYNLGESKDDFKFEGSRIQTKEDGSLLNVFYWAGKWHVNTRGSFGYSKICDWSNRTWKQAFLDGCGVSYIEELNLNPCWAYACELCAPENKVVRNYGENPKVFCTAIFEGERELTIDEFNAAFPAKMSKPQEFAFANVSELSSWLDKNSKNDASFEGFVLTDNNQNRIKVKSKAYLSLHAIRGEGDNLHSPKHLLPFVMRFETDELLVYFPECAEAVKKLQKQYNKIRSQLQRLWERTNDIKSQKDFAFAIQNQCPLYHLLFEVRKGKSLDEVLLACEKLILQHILSL